MYIGLRGIQIGQLAGAAGATKLSLQLSATPAPMQAVGTQQSEYKLDVSLPAAQMMNAAAIVTVDALAQFKSQTDQAQVLKSEGQIFADSMNAKTGDLWKLMARFLTNPDSFTANLLGQKTKTAVAQNLPAQKATAALKTTPTVTTPSAPVESPETNYSEPTPANQAAKTNAAVTLMGNGIDIDDVSLELPGLPKTAPVASAGTAPAQAIPQKKPQLKTDAAVAQATGSFESVVPYSISQLERVRTILLSAGVTLEGGKIPQRNSSEVSRAKASDSCEVFQSHANPRHLRGIARDARATSKESPAPRTFKRSNAVGRSPAFLVGNIKSRKVRKTEPAQIVRVAIAGKASRRIVFARVPGTRGGYRFAGIERLRNTPEARRRSAPHALGTPHAERQLQPTALSLAPPAVGGGETAYTMPDPRELRPDERQVLMSMLKNQLALGPSSLGDPAIREQFNSFMFSNTVGEMSHYVTSDQWNAMVRATILYAARAVLPFSNNSITGTAAEYLFDDVDAEQRYDEWMNHFGISGLSDIAMVDTFVEDDRSLSMPEYFLKGIMDYLTGLAPMMHAYDDDAMPLPFLAELSLQWETVGFIHDPAISSDAELISAATAFAEELAALDVGAAQHFVELALISTRINTDSIQGVWNEDQAVALVGSCIDAGLRDIVDAIGRNQELPRRPRRLVAMAKEARNAQEDKFELGLEMLTKNLAEAIQSGAFSIDMEEEELRLN